MVVNVDGKLVSIAAGGALVATDDSLQNLHVEGMSSDPNAVITKVKMGNTEIMNIPTNLKTTIGGFTGTGLQLGSTHNLGAAAAASNLRF